MRFYLNVPLVAGYVSMATVACLGMLQLAAARGGYAGLALFTTDRQRGTQIGLGLTVSALLAYVAFAPEVLTPGPAGTEVAEMFAICVLVALAITLAGADRRLRRARQWQNKAGEPLTLGALPATLYRPLTLEQNAPAAVLLPDPTGFVVAPQALVEALQGAGVAVLALDSQGVMESDAPLSRQTLLGHLSMALVQLEEQAGIDTGRIGLLGLGLGGDAVLRAAVTDPQIKAAMAVSTVANAPLELVSSQPGLSWLRESSYRQVWRWRRLRSTLQNAAAELKVADSAPKNPAVPVAISQVNPTASNRRHFTPLEDTKTLNQVVSWFYEKLINAKSRSAALRGLDPLATSDE